MTSASARAQPAPEERRDGFDVERIRADFPILSKPVHGKRLAFLDSAASAQKPRRVIDAMSAAYETEYANVNRGTYWLSQIATENFEACRKAVASFINAPGADNVILTRNVTYAINLVAACYGRTFLKAGDEIVISRMEHHANIVPWQMLREATGIVIRVAPIDEAGNFLLGEYEKLLGPKTKLVAITQASNVLGTIPPVAEIIRLAHDAGAVVLVDGAQGVVHGPVDVQALDADFYGFTGHKLYGPTGIGALYGKMELLDAMPPFEGGGDMIDRVTFEKTTFRAPPHRFEAGTPMIVEAVGLHAAIDYVSEIGFDAIAAHERGLLDYATARIGEIPGIAVVGTADEKCSILSFTMKGAHPHDIGTIVDRAGVAIRTGHHCAQPLMDYLGIDATARASFALYNNREDVDQLIASLAEVSEIFG
jgi:cysteine desulfurase/selenocysteine lyase